MHTEMQKYAESCICMVQCVQSHLQECKDEMWPDSIAAVSKFSGHLCFKCLGVASLSIHVQLLMWVVTQFGMLICKVCFWRAAPACPLLPFQQSILNGSSRSLTLLNRGGVSHFPHKINEITRSGNGLVPKRKGSRMTLIMVPGSTCSVANEIQPCLGNGISRAVQLFLLGLLWENAGCFTTLGYRVWFHSLLIYDLAASMTNRPHPTGGSSVPELDTKPL